MWPFHLRIGFLAAGPVELLILLGILVVCFMTWRKLKPLGVSPGSIFDLALGSVIGGAIGARLFYFLPLWIRGIEKGGALVGSWSEGSAFYGGVLGGLVGCAVVARLKKIPVLAVFDAGSAWMPLAFASGKLGCFLAGCCYGVRCASPPGIAFAPDSLAYRTQIERGELPPGSEAALPVHAAQLYEMTFGLLLFAALAWFRKRTDRPGEVTLAYFVVYSVWRFAIEFLRDDPGRDGFNAGISDSQVTALVIVGVGTALWVALRRRPAAPTPA